MASRRDELNAYTFEKKRTVASFLRPSPTGSDEGAPRPLRGFLPGLVIGALILAGFGAWGMFRPQAPKGWDKPGKNVIIASDSTTRYVVLRTDGKTQLHPVLNLASAKLLLDPDSYQIVKVAERELDSGRIPHGPTIGIPYAPDRLPGKTEAGTAKRWAVCEKPAAPGRPLQRGTFVLAAREHNAVDGQDRLRRGEVMYVRDAKTRDEYLVSANGTKYRVGTRNGSRPGTPERDLLVRILASGEPQRVSKEWLATYRDGTPVDFPRLRGDVGAPAGVNDLDNTANRVGMVLVATTGDGDQHYLVEPGRVVPVTAFTASLVLSSPATGELRQNGRPLRVGAQTIFPTDERHSPTARYDWPRHRATQVNRGGRDTLCSVLRSVHATTGRTTVSTWAGKDYPRTLVDKSTSAYVTPGAGLLFRQFQGSDPDTGGVFLMTDTGLRYAVQSNADSSTDKAPRRKPDSGAPEVDEAQIRLGYRGVKPSPVPMTWAQFLPTGPRLDTTSARQPQGS
ncbi:type VII secretion protein EccB [Streptomyces sp. OF3]|uniref:Type VII secretion protein EccB n=1 Tax=Streptomyces alkaliterrae TaxID=2213162 RepID=A0A7W3WPG1_9ACTN|nr:type VII secretion protein EccB [Streptomyces alkaliterrae]MBB1256098.1 type VII secretion protein EccB [Streptomyces alkaliterrae]